ncbi:hypothetical protein C7M84_013952 [Penaeus vannamei]|uniref:Uncharacterized protein n=1 Tax=Penaeus vannamei TaxID=6689 RepID=A0A3R7SN01_PENVA|nr:hypothetical protein C7M84_013952 [Penaeus vannamei]
MSPIRTGDVVWLTTIALFMIQYGTSLAKRHRRPQYCDDIQSFSTLYHYLSFLFPFTSLLCSCYPFLLSPQFLFFPLFSPFSFLSFHSPLLSFPCVFIFVFTPFYIPTIFNFLSPLSSLHLSPSLFFSPLLSHILFLPSSPSLSPRFLSFLYLPFPLSHSFSPLLSFPHPAFLLFLLLEQANISAPYRVSLLRLVMPQRARVF